MWGELRCRLIRRAVCAGRIAESAVDFASDGLELTARLLQLRRLGGVGVGGRGTGAFGLLLLQRYLGLDGVNLGAHTSCPRRHHLVRPPPYGLWAAAQHLRRQRR